MELNTASYGHKFLPVVHVDQVKNYFSPLDDPTLEEDLLAQR